VSECAIGREREREEGRREGGKEGEARRETRARGREEAAKRAGEGDEGVQECTSETEEQSRPGSSRRK